MLWESALKGFKQYMLLERNMSPHSIEAYLADVQKLSIYMADSYPEILPHRVELFHVEHFLGYLHDLGPGSPYTSSHLVRHTFILSLS